MSSLKEKLYKQCLNYVKTRMEAAEEGIRETQEAQNDDTKSSAGDKYETGREMMQQETDRYMAQLDEANKLRVALNAISTSETFTTAEPGSVIFTNNGNFYLAIGAGMMQVDGLSFYAVSPASPIGLKLKGQKTGSEFSLNNKTYQVTVIE